MRPYLLVCLAFLMIACLLGCQSHEVSHNPGVDVVPTSVKVIFDGKPVEGARVSLSPIDAQQSASGVTDAEGIAKLTTFDPNDGVAPGKYRVKISKDEIETIKKADPNDPTAADVIKTLHHLPEKYGNYKTSGFTANVVENEESSYFEFELK